MLRTIYHQIALTALAGGALTLLWLAGGMRSFDLPLGDGLLRWTRPGATQSRGDAEARVAAVVLDDEALDRLGGLPWPRALHRFGAHPQGPWIAVNCGAIPENLLESELFGHRKGSFTGAVRDHKGSIETARGGTILLDEIGEVPPFFQVKLLRFLQEGEIRPVGAGKGPGGCRGAAELPR